jgi:hypothetical protein
MIALTIHSLLAVMFVVAAVMTAMAVVPRDRE